MATLFTASQTDAFNQGMSQQPILQRQWLKTRNERCAKGDMHSCLVETYDERLNELAVAALFQAPDVALTELDRQNPKSAVLYEAIYRYATIADAVGRASVVAKLIGPAFESFHEKPWAQPLSDVADAHDAAASDKNFSAFLDVASVSDYALTMPCSALARRPGLIDALDAVYGGAIDGQLIRSDCEAMTSSLEALDRLTKAAVAAQPFCPSTIRFSLGRNFGKTLVAVRLHRTDLWKAKKLDVSPGGQDESNDDPAKDEDEPRFVARHPVLIRNATDGLARYYSNRFGVPPSLAEAQALEAVSTIIFGAYDLCE
ncbi:hypothetical protein D7S89_12155 [Trinickia fusca]|uniref:Uncharacterized protein n=2 Tax=Trinickia fusca TaxID=2419777 RepID=A0A494XB98_9BURK|nr:hypothetical protein D7S89_12155 [Trinickia fusca]